MNPNWTGRAARTLNDCRFWDADPVIRFRDDSETRSERFAGVILAIVIGISLALLLVHELAK